MKKNTSIIFRVSGILFFIITLANVLEIFDVNISSFYFLLEQENTFWGVFLIFESILYTTSFLFSLFATGTAALFAGKNGFSQSVWNCSVYSVVTLAIYTIIQIFTGIESEIQFFLVQSIIMQILFMIIVFVCLKEESEFSAKNIIPSDTNSKLCLKIYAIMLLIFEIASFILANIFLEN